MSIAAIGACILLMLILLVLFQVKNALLRTNYLLDQMVTFMGGEDVRLNGEIIRLVRSGNKVEAVKLYRKLTMASLQEASNAIDEIEKANQSNA